MYIKHCLASAIRWLTGLLTRKTIPRTRDVEKFHRKRPSITNVCRYRGAGNPPPLTWKACDPATIRCFKAVLTCPNGHTMTLRAHAIESNGAVSPSVVCRTTGCAFHDFVRLTDWDLGRLAAGNRGAGDSRQSVEYPRTE
jgi:hypothetical protein